MTTGKRRKRGVCVSPVGAECEVTMAGEAKHGGRVVLDWFGVEYGADCICGESAEDIVARLFANINERTVAAASKKLGNNDGK